MLQRLAVTNPKNDEMDPYGVNPTLSIFCNKILVLELNKQTTINKKLDSLATRNENLIC